MYRLDRLWGLKGLGFREDVHSFIGFVNFTGSKGLTGFSGAYRIYGWGFRAHGSRYVTVLKGLSLWSFGPRFPMEKCAERLLGFFTWASDFTRVYL